MHPNRQEQAEVLQDAWQQMTKLIQRRLDRDTLVHNVSLFAMPALWTFDRLMSEYLIALLLLGSTEAELQIFFSTLHMHLLRRHYQNSESLP
jgi:hypothetical protein